MLVSKSTRTVLRTHQIVVSKLSVIAVVYCTESLSNTENWLGYLSAFNMTGLHWLRPQIANTVFRFDVEFIWVVFISQSQSGKLEMRKMFAYWIVLICVRVFSDKLAPFLSGGTTWEGLPTNELVLEESMDKKNNILLYIFPTNSKLTRAHFTAKNKNKQKTTTATSSHL